MRVRRRRRTYQTEYEFKQVVIEVNAEMPDITEHMHDGWWIADQIVCPPFVVLLLEREMEEEPDEKEIA